MLIYIPASTSPEGASSAPDVIFFEDFFGPEPSATDDLATFDLVGSSAGSALADDELNGVCTLTSNSTTEAQLVQNGEPYRLSAGRRIIFETRVNLTDHDGMNFAAGIGITDADVHATSWTDYIGFFTTDGNIKIGCGKDNNNVPGSGTSGETDTDTGIDFASDRWVVLKFIVEGTTEVKFFVDGVFAGRITTNLPDNENLTAIIATKGDGETVDVDYVLVKCQRDTAA